VTQALSYGDFVLNVTDSTQFTNLLGHHCFREAIVLEMPATTGTHQITTLNSDANSEIGI
jgi:hypothetical protein